MRRIDTRNYGHPGAGYLPSIREHSEYRQPFLDTRNALSGKIQTQVDAQMHELLDPQKAAEHVRKKQEDMHRRLNAVATSYREPVAEMHTRVLKQFQGAPEARAALVRIMHGLTTPADSTADHPYYTGNGLHFLKIEEDQRLLDTLAKTQPDLTTEFTTMRNGLEELARQDQRYGIRQFEKFREQPTRTDQLLGGALKGTVFLIGAVGFLVCAIPDTIRLFRYGKAPVASAIYLTLALATVPSFRNMFSSKEQAMLREVDRTANHPLFRNLCTQYNVSGPSWARYVQRLMSDNTAERALVTKIQRNGKRVNGLEKEIDAYVRLSGLGASEKADLQRMIVDGRFPDFVQALGSVTDTDAQAITQDFVRSGASVYESNIKTTKQQINRPTR